MSFFSVLGGIGKTIGKTALGAVGSTVGFSGLADVFDKKPSGNGATVSAAASLHIGDESTGSPTTGGGSLLGNLNGMLGSVSQFLNGGAKVNVQASLGNNNASGLPSWLPIAGIGLVLVMLLKGSGGGGRRRY